MPKTTDDSNESFFGSSLMDSLYGKPVEKEFVEDDLRVHKIPDLPEIGKNEHFYADGVARADRDGDKYSREAYKVGQYVTLALDPKTDWPTKAKYFSHVLRRHCVPPGYAQGDLKDFFEQLADLVREHAGAEALRICCEQDELFAVRRSMEQDVDDIADDAEAFFDTIVPPGEKCPSMYREEDWRQLKMIRDQWV